MKQYKKLPIITKLKNKYNNYEKISLTDSLIIDFTRLMDHAIKKHLSKKDKHNLLRINLYKLFKIYRAINGCNYSERQLPLIYHLIKRSITKYPSNQFNDFKYSQYLINGTEILTASYKEHLHQQREIKKLKKINENCIKIFSPDPTPQTWEELKFYTKNRIFEEKHNIN